MKKITHTLLLFMITTSLSFGQAFITTWKTDNPGTSNDNEITIPTDGTGFNYTVDWGDESSDTGVTGDITHTYASPGTYTITISGDFPKISFVNDGDKEKLLSVEQWGNIQWSGMIFWGCKNLVINATDAPDLSNATSLISTFRDCHAMTGDLSGWDVANITNMDFTFLSARSFNSDISGWDVSNVTTMR
ncbi:MAG: BspA family leucine-rich repeat surface protein, partial [Fulvivirga sp.]